MNYKFVLGNIPVEQSTSNSQLDNSTNLSKFADLENSANSEVCMFGTILNIIVF